MNTNFVERVVTTLTPDWRMQSELVWAVWREKECESWDYIKSWNVKNHLALVDLPLNNRHTAVERYTVQLEDYHLEVEGYISDFGLPCFFVYKVTRMLLEATYTECMFPRVLHKAYSKTETGW